MASDNAFMVVADEMTTSGGGMFLAVEGFMSVCGGGQDAPMQYRMRGFDQSLGQDVYWTSPAIDTAATAYSGPGPVISAKVFKVIPGINR